MGKKTPQKDEWTEQDKRRAWAWGWDIFDRDSSGKLEIQHLTDPHGVAEEAGAGPYTGPVWNSDEEVVGSLKVASARGDAFATHALKCLKQDYDRRYRERRKRDHDRFKLAMKLLNTAPVNYKRVIGNLSSDQLQDLQKQLTCMMQGAAQVLGYAKACHSGHDKAVKSCNQLLTTTRRTLGFGMPHAANINF